MSEHTASEESKSECGNYNAVLKSGVDVDNTERFFKNGTYRSSRSASSDPGSKAYPWGGFAPAVAVAETFTNGRGAVCDHMRVREHERGLPNIPPEPEVVPTKRVAFLVDKVLYCGSKGR